MQNINCWNIYGGFYVTFILKAGFIPTAIRVILHGRTTSDQIVFLTDNQFPQ